MNSYSVRCPICGHEHDAKTAAEANKLYDSWKRRMAAEAEVSAIRAVLDQPLNEGDGTYRP